MRSKIFQRVDFLLKKQGFYKEFDQWNQVREYREFKEPEGIEPAYPKPKYELGEKAMNGEKAFPHEGISFFQNLMLSSILPHTRSSKASPGAFYFRGINAFFFGLKARFVISTCFRARPKGRLSMSGPLPTFILARPSDYSNYLCASSLIVCLLLLEKKRKPRKI